MFWISHIWNLNAIGRLEILQFVYRSCSQIPKSKIFPSPNMHSQEKWIKKIKILKFLEKHPYRIFWISHIWNLKAIGRLEILHIVYRKLPRKSKIFLSPNTHSQEKWFKKIKISKFLKKHPCIMFWISIYEILIHSDD